MNLRDFLTVVITTHVLPSAPSSEIIERTISSIRNNFIGISDCKFMIYCDSKVNHPDYSSYLENLNKIENVIIVDRPHDGIPYTGLQNNYIEAVAGSSTPFAFVCEHDWTFVREVDTPKLIKAMIKYNFINFVRFNKRDNAKSHRDAPPPGDDGACFWETYVEEERDVEEQPLMKTDSIATHPHIVRIDKFKNDWLHLAKPVRPGFAGMVEQNLYDAYTKDIRKLGFNTAHKKWGVYNYGSREDLKIIVHTDGSNSGRV